MQLNIALLPGDGIGKEIVAQAVRVVETVAEKMGHETTFTHGLVGADAIDKTGDPYPEATHQVCMDADAVLFGAIGDPKYDNDPTAKVRPEQGLLRMRKQLGLYANIRPVTPFQSLLKYSPIKEEIVSGANFVTVRELTGGIYFGKPQGRSEDGTTAYDTCVYHNYEVERILTMAFELAMNRNKKLTVVDKANVLASSRLWREIANKMAPQYPEVTLDFLFVDNAAMQIITNPRQFDVMVTENMFGDILTDEASVIAGSLGLLPSASIGKHTSVFEPIHGSYPQVAGQNIANPCATILSAAMMFEYAFNLNTEASLITEAVEASIEAGIVTREIADDSNQGATTTEVGEWICNYIQQKIVDHTPKLKKEALV